MPMNPYEPPQEVGTVFPVRRATRQWHFLVAAFVLTTALTALAFNFGMAVGLGSPPSIPSIPNMLFASTAGTVWGVIGSFPIGVLVYFTRPGFRSAVITVCSIGWAAPAGCT